MWFGSIRTVPCQLHTRLSNTGSSDSADPEDVTEHGHMLADRLVSDDVPPPSGDSPVLQPKILRLVMLRVL